MAREQRRLAAILSTDVVGYARLIGRDERGAVARLREHRIRRLEPAVARHRGRLVRLGRDGALVEFANAVDALGAAIAFQQAMVDANRGQLEDSAIVFRIGLHLGEVIVEGYDDLYGEDVNVARLLGEQAPPGGIVVSGTVREAAAGRVKAAFAGLGNAALGTIERPIQAYGVSWDPADWRVSPAAPPPTSVDGRRAGPRGRKQFAPWLAVAAGLAILLGAGWLALSSRSPPTRATLHELGPEDHERLIAEMKGLEEEAGRRADAATAAKRRADAGLHKARSERRQAEDELARLKAEAAERRELAAAADERQVADPEASHDADDQSRRRIESAMAGLRRAEADAFARAVAEAQIKRQADEALVRARAQRHKAEAAAAEAGLRLGPADRQRLQVALMAQGFDISDADGIFGPRSREMIASWQQKVGAPATGFVTQAQRDELVRGAAAAIAHWEEGRKRAEEAAKMAAAAPEPALEPNWPAPPPPPANAYDGAYAGAAMTRSGGRLSTFKVEVRDGSGSGVQSRLDCGQAPLSLTVSDTGEVSGTAQLFGPTCIRMDRPLKGRAVGRSLLLTIDGQFVELMKPN